METSFSFYRGQQSAVVSRSALQDSLDVSNDAWTALVVAADAIVDEDAADLLEELAGMDAAERAVLEDVRLPVTHPERPRDALAVIRACTSRATGAVVAALLGRGDDARRYLAFVHRAWGDEDLLTQPMRTVRGGAVPEEREVDGVAGWAGSRPVRVGNGANQQRQYDSLGLFAEAVSVYVQVGGELDDCSRS